MTYNPFTDLASRPEITLVMGAEPGEAGYFDADEVVIGLAVGLKQRERRCTVAHELAHAERGDRPVEGADGARLTRRQERHVDRIYSRRLVSLEELADAMLWTMDEYELAEYLWVDNDTLMTRLRSLTDAENDYLCRLIDAAEARFP